jgi:hypothetical protein
VKSFSDFLVGEALIRVKLKVLDNFHIGKGPGRLDLLFLLSGFHRSIRHQY